MKDTLREDVCELINLTEVYEELIDRLSGVLGPIGREVNSWALREKLLGAFYKEDPESWLVKYQGKEALLIYGHTLWPCKVCGIKELPGGLWLAGVTGVLDQGHGLRMADQGKDQGHGQGVWVLPCKLTLITNKLSTRSNYASPRVKDMGEKASQQ